VRREDGREITERRALTQADLEKVPREHWADCRYVNLHARDGEIVSCLIYGPDSEVVGSRRAFWWSLAKVRNLRRFSKLWAAPYHGVTLSRKSAHLTNRELQS
jgi:hypothetical protein